MPLDDLKLCEEFIEMRVLLQKMHNDLLGHIAEEDQLKDKVDKLLVAWNTATGVVWFIKKIAAIILVALAVLEGLKHLGMLR